MPLKLTEAEIEAGKSPKGGWTRDQLAKWFVPWPPPSGWKQALLRGEYIPVSPGHKVAVSVENSQPSPIRSNVSAHDLLREVVVAVINAGHASDLYGYPDVLEYFGARANSQPTFHDSGWKTTDDSELP